MKIQLSLLLSVFLSFSSSAQQIIEQKVIYSTPGAETDLMSFYGVRNIEEIDNYSRNQYSTKMELIDLQDHGFLLRDKHKIILINNEFGKLAEHDLGAAFIEKGAKKIEFFPAQEGIWIIQRPKSIPESVKVGLLNYLGELKIGMLSLPDKYKSINCYYSYPNNAFVVSTSATEGKQTAFWEYYFDDSPETFRKTERVEEVTDNKEIFADQEKRYQLDFVNLDTSASGRQYKVILRTKDLQGNCEIIVKDVNSELNKECTLEINIPEYADINSDTKAYGFRGDIMLYVDEKNADFYVFHTVQKYTFLQSLIMVNGNLSTQTGSGMIKYSVEDLEKLKIPVNYFGQYSLSNIMIPADETVYDLNDYLLLNFHARHLNRNIYSGIVEVPSGKAVSTGGSSATPAMLPNLLELAIDKKNLQIRKASFLNHSFRCLNHERFKMLPEKITELYKDSEYKQQEIDLIYKQAGKENSENYLYRIVRKNGHSYIFTFKEENSEVEVMKVKF